MIYQDDAKEIEKLRIKLYQSMNQFGLQSIQVQKQKGKIESILERNLQQKTDFFLYEYRIACAEMKSYIKKRKKIPPELEWDYYAKLNRFLSSKQIREIKNLI